MGVKRVLCLYEKKREQSEVWPAKEKRVRNFVTMWWGIKGVGGAHMWVKI